MAVVDNDAAMRDSLAWLIHSYCGYRVVSYASGLSYLDSAVDGERPGCLILDIHMPEMNGLELYGILKTRDPELPVIFITGYPDQHLAEKARRLEPHGFFTKPLDTDALIDCLDRALGTQAVNDQ